MIGCLKTENGDNTGSISTCCYFSTGSCFVPLKVVSRINLTGSLLPLAAVISKEINLDVVDAAEALALAMLPELLVTEVPAESLAAATLEEEDVAILLIN